MSLKNLRFKRNTTVSSRGIKNEWYNEVENALKQGFCPTCGADIPNVKTRRNKRNTR